MSVSQHVPHSQSDLIKEVQSAIEGDVLTDPTKFGVHISDPAFLAVGPDGGSITVTYNPTINKRKKAGALIRSGTNITKKAWTAKLTFKASDNNVALQKWCKNKSAKGGIVTPAASRTFLKSYGVGTALTETFEVYYGCLPTKTNYTINASGEVIYTVDLVCKTVVQTTSANGGIIIGSGSFASPDTAAPWINTDGGAGAFIHNTKKYGLISLSVDIIRQYAEQNPSESLEIMMLAESDYVVSGSATIEKSDILLDTDALGTTSRAMSIALKAATLTDTFTNAIFEGHTGLSHDGSDSAGLTDSLAWSADDQVSA